MKQYTCDLCKRPMTEEEHREFTLRQPSDPLSPASIKHYEICHTCSLKLFEALEADEPKSIWTP